MLMSIFLLCGITLIAAVPLAWWIKREGERSWRRHQAIARAARQREQFARLNKAFIDFRVVLVDSMTPALRKCAAEIARLEVALREEPKP